MLINIFSRVLIILGSLNYLLKVTTDINIFKQLCDPMVVKIIKLLIGLSGLLLLFDRNYYLPFLGETVMPLVIKRDTKNKKLTKIKLTELPPNTTVVAWAAKGSTKTFGDPFKAYDDYSNSVIAKSDKNGVAIVELECPARYNVNKFGIMPEKLARHIHYRYQLPDRKGLFSQAFTKELNDKCQ